MPMRTDSVDPAELTPEQRLQEIAAILAEGVCRMYRRPAIDALPATESDAGVPAGTGQNAPVSRSDCLELSA